MRYKYYRVLQLELKKKYRQYQMKNLLEIIHLVQ